MTGSIVACITGILDALGLGNVVQSAEGEVPSALQATVDNVLAPNGADNLASVINGNCDVWLLNTFSGTCGLQTQGVAALVDLLFCVWQDAGSFGANIQSIERLNGA